MKQALKTPGKMPAANASRKRRMHWRSVSSWARIVAPAMQRIGQARCSLHQNLHFPPSADFDQLQWQNVNRREGVPRFAAVGG
jgi:hypothetical protein